MSDPIRDLKAVVGWRLRNVTWPRHFHYWRAVPGFFRYRRLYRSIVRQAVSGAHFVEVGSWKGQSAVFMATEIANSGKAIRFDCVDHWQGSDEERHHSDLDVQKGALFEAFRHYAKARTTYINPVQLPSTEAATLYPDQTLDFVMIDGAHDYESVVSDLAAWAPKVKLGGLLAGDDFNWPDVAKAVRERFPDAARVDRGQWLVRV